MFGRFWASKPRKTLTQITIEGDNYPVQLVVEPRSNARASIGNNGFLFRLPIHAYNQNFERHFGWFRQWALHQVQARAGLKEFLLGRDYQSGDILSVMGEDYYLLITEEDRKTDKTSLDQQTIKLLFAKEKKAPSTRFRAKAMISTVMAKEYRNRVEEEVNEINDLYFNASISGIRLKYMRRNWWSCSRSGQINLSTRLLLASDEARRYVIVHELAHLKEFNHSASFWRHVSEVIPDYKKIEKWLKDHHYDCDF